MNEGFDTQEDNPESGSGATTASHYAADLLDALGFDAAPATIATPPHPDADWAQSGARALTGHADGPALDVDAPVAACARGAWHALVALAPALADSGIDAPRLLSERAAIAGLERAGRTTPGGAGRLLRTRDGWVALQVPRPDDVDALPAWLESEPADANTDPLDHAAALAGKRSTDELVQRGRWLGLAVAAMGELDDRATPISLQPAEVASATAPARAMMRRDDGAPLRVLDLSVLWAGPLCGSLLAAAGADVAKVESPRRIDGARSGPPAFFDLMNGEKSSTLLDFEDAEGRAVFLRLVAAADVVIESARPRALQQLGIDAAQLVRAHPGLTWVSITGHGREGDAGERIGFGDDAAVAAGLVGRDHVGQPVFCADAVADPLTGLHAAASAFAGCERGGGLFDVSLAGVAHRVAHTPRLEPNRSPRPAEPPRTRLPRGVAPPAGRDTRDVIARWHAGGGDEAGERNPREHRAC